ncbi:hypothetical protein D187_008498 [Cystobacter fuscus DSM 2262]|uniref:Uncharacterized protein n=1 Tax=Cystobacter fuscus (strain ATCC 25194 / DSM 2262 / NBRC 100088 / M29) TaxID=1242864 RepID=S9PGU5_CYSF2|nr:hypothetical protein D187_008498 [Cystobacter fuscus DSM 2262]
MLAEPKGLLGGVDQATRVLRRDTEALIGVSADFDSDSEIPLAK